MFPFLSMLGNIASSIGMTGVGAGLSSIGGMGGGAGGSMPFGFGGGASTTPGTAANGGWETTVTPAMSPLAKIGQALRQEQGGGGQSPMPKPPDVQMPQPVDARRPADVSQLLSIIQNRSRLGV